VVTFNNKRYHTFNYHLKNTFGTKVYKIAVDAGFTCPNRDGTAGYGGCIYCNERGSGAEYLQKNLPLEKQIIHGMKIIKRRYESSRFLVYFQPFSNTYGHPEKLKTLYDRALAFDEVAGICIGTRADCLNKEILDLLEYYSKKTYFWLELGLQSIHEKTLRLINRGHSYQDFLTVYHQTRKRNIRTCFHVIIGLPGETREDILETAREVARLKPEGIKIHSLYIEKDTALEKFYDEKPFKLFSKDEYIDILIEFLELLPEETVIQRVMGESNKTRLVAPEWILDKPAMLNMLDKELSKRDSWQGKKYHS